MMMKLLRKEFKLTVQPFNYIFLLFSAMMLIPNYPLNVTFFYTTLGIYLMFLGCGENNDVTFTSLLPVRKGDVVRARCLTVAILELVQLVAAVPFAWLRGVLYKGTEIEVNAFTEPNAYFFGTSLVLFAIFNAVFIPRYYKNTKISKVHFLVPCIVVFVYILLIEIPAFLPATKDYVHATGIDAFVMQLPALLIGAAIYAVGMALTCRRSVRIFEHADL